MGQHAQGHQIVDLREFLALTGHLLIDGPEVLGAAEDLVAVQTVAAQLLVERLDRVVGVLLALGPAVLHHAGHAGVLLGIEVEEGQVLELPLDGADAQAVGQRGVDVHRLTRLVDLAVGRDGRKGPHVVQTVGQLHDHDADVLGHREEHLAEVESLLLVHRLHVDGGELGDAIDDLGHALAEALAHLVESRRGVLHCVVQKGRAD